MIARLTVATPFVMYLPEGAEYTLYSHEEEGYTIVVRVPVKSDVPIRAELPEEVAIDERPAFAANALQFDFHKDTFDRRRGEGMHDPPVALMRRVLNRVVIRLRYVTRAPELQAILFPSGTKWRLQYLNDDETELKEDPLLIRGLGGHAVNISYVAVSPSVWQNVFSLDPDWQAPVWDTILLDAHRSLPHVGSAVTLGATALEVFIADVLSSLQGAKPLPEDIWSWVNKRDNWLKEPSTEEQFDFLLRHFSGHSLKEDAPLWTGFKNLRQARNTFVHEGSARVGSDTVDVQRARELLASARSVIDRVRSWLPAERRWPQFESNTTVTTTIPIIKGSRPDA